MAIKLRENEIAHDRRTLAASLAGEIRAGDVAGGIKVALLTTVFGLIAAIILQIFYNYIVSKVDGIVTKMEEASIALVDSLAANKIFSKNAFFDLKKLNIGLFQRTKTTIIRFKSIGCHGPTPLKLKHH